MWPWLPALVGVNLITGGLTGELVVPPKEQAPKTVEIRSRSVSLDGSPEQLLKCAVDQRRLRCDASEGEVDLEIHVPGFARLYRWDVGLHPDATYDLGRLELSRGSEISGRVRLSGANARSVRVELRPASRPEGQQASRIGLRVLSTSPDRGGHFAFADLSPGAYAVTVRCPGWAEVTQTVTARAGTDVVLPPARLHPLNSATILISPPVDPRGQLWEVRLERPIPETVYRQTVRAVRASFGGIASLEKLEDGPYIVSCYSAAGERLTTREVVISGNTSIPLAVDCFPIAGTVTIGENRVAARVDLVWADGSRQTFRSGRDGVFTGCVTHEGSWRAVIRTSAPPSEVHLDRVRVVRAVDTGVARVELAVPSTEIFGTVVDERGDPVRRASLLFLENEALVGNTSADDEGHFTFVGLGSGPAEVRAMTNDGARGAARLNVVADERNEVRVVVSESATITGSVRDPAGNAVPGAMIYVVDGGSEVRSVSTGLSGDFSLQVGRGPAAVGLCVVAPGLPRKLILKPLRETSADPLQIVLGPAYGTLRVSLAGASNWPLISSDGGPAVPLFCLLAPSAGGPAAEYRDGGFDFEIVPGSYVLCIGRDRPACVEKALSAGETATATFDAATRSWK